MPTETENHMLFGLTLHLPATKPLTSHKKHNKLQYSKRSNLNRHAKEQTISTIRNKKKHLTSHNAFSSIYDPASCITC